MARRIRLNALEDTLREILAEYGDSITEGTAEATIKTARTAASELKSVSPKGSTGKYAKGWKVQIERGRLYTACTVYNGKKPGLPHLLEFGHVLRNGTGRTYGEGGARPHIAAVESKALDDYERAVKEVIQE